MQANYFPVSKFQVLELTVICHLIKSFIDFKI